MNKILMIAFHYPPLAISSGVQRTLKFSEYLRDYGWLPIVLTASTKAYQQTDDHQLREIPPDIVVRRAGAFDAARHFSVGKRYPGFLALPDRWASWWVQGVLSGLSVIKKRHPTVIWSTYPIATAHLIGLTLHRITGLPWIADFRDSMTEDHYPRDKRTRKIYRWIEEKSVRNAVRVVFTAPGALEMYSKRYPDIPESRWTLIENGFDERNFQETVQSEKNVEGPKGPVKLVHSGILYPNERDPRPFFKAIAALKSCGEISSSNLRIVFRGSGHDGVYEDILKSLKIDDVVRLEQPVNYSEALKEMLNSEGLLLFQGANCNHQIPAKVYEYLRAKRPIFALTDPDGDTAHVLKRAGIDFIVRLDSESEIKEGMIRFIESIKKGDVKLPNDELIATFSREAKTRELAELLDSIHGSDDRTHVSSQSG